VVLLAKDSVQARAVDSALQHWRQGDLALEVEWFVHVADPAQALTEAAGQAGGEGPKAIMSQVAGLAVVTQTCDVVRSCCERPYIEVAPLVAVDDHMLHDIQRGRRSKFASLPALIDRKLVVDLDRVMTVEKSIAAMWRRTPGYTSDAEGRAFARALSRKRERFAFPDDFNCLVDKLRSRLTGKHERSTDEGVALRALSEIRVQASPSWEAMAIELFFWFIRNEDQVEPAEKGWDDLLDGWLKLMPSSGRFTQIRGQLATIEDMTAAQYLDSDRLDLDHLSMRA